MSLTAKVLFDVPQQEIASLIASRMTQSTSTSIVTGFATPGGLGAIAAAFKAQPTRLNTMVIGAATYPGFRALDDLLAVGVPRDRLLVHLGHSCKTNTKKHPFARYHPMLHSKVYYIELPGDLACAFIGSHNLTSFALMGLNGEASVMLEGPINSPEFDSIRSHIQTSRSQAIQYSSDMKDAYAWWMREFLDGLRTEIEVPQDWQVVRTILLFASASKTDRPKTGDNLYFETPAGIEQIETLTTETHLFLFDTLPADPWQALASAANADAKYKCKTIGAENQQGNLEVSAEWHINEKPDPVLERVVSGTLRPMTSSGRQQVRAEVETSYLEPAEYSFEREKVGWDPEFSQESTLSAQRILTPHPANQDGFTEPLANSTRAMILEEATGKNRAKDGWKLVKALKPRLGAAMEKDAAALKLATPDSGSFILVSLRKRKLGRTG